MLGRAFQDDPLMAYVVPRAARRAAVLPSFFRVVLRYCLRYGVVYIPQTPEGVACCLPPRQTQPSLIRLLRIVLGGALWLPGPLELRRSLRAARYAEEAHACVSPTPHWYLWVLGVEPALQGQGTGSQLIQRVLRTAGAQRMPCYLETENPRNIPFYQKHGFRLMQQIALAPTDVHISAMLWEPDERPAGRI